MSRPNRPRQAAPTISETAWAWLCGGPIPEDGDRAERWRLEHSGEGAVLWRRHREDVLSWWISEHPGSRPSLWWRFDAPEPRYRLGGIGTACHERLAHVPRYHLGLPIDWITRDDIRSYDLLGEPLGTPPLDEADPPLFESEAAYLGRLGLLAAAERRRLTDADFEPVSILDVLDGDE